MTCRDQPNRSFDRENLDVLAADIVQTARVFYGNELFGMELERQCFRERALARLGKVNYMRIER